MTVIYETKETALANGRQRIIYLAGPYTHGDPQIREQRYNIITSVAADLISQGYIVFSPLTMTHPCLPLRTRPWAQTTGLNSMKLLWSSAQRSWS